MYINYLPILGPKLYGPSAVALLAPPPPEAALNKWVVVFA
jgi:hypothetical protein